MRLPAKVVTRATMLSCGVCGEVRFVQATITTTPSEEQPCAKHIAMDVEVEIDPRDYDIAERFGRVHLEPRALVLR